jgi:myosin heavy subunit
MNTSNTPVAKEENVKATKNNKNAIIAVLAIALVAMAGYLFYDKSKSNTIIDQQDVKISTISTEKSELQSSFDASLARLDSMETVTNSLNADLAGKNKEIAQAKVEIRNILNKKNATASELIKAKSLIAGLNSKIAGMEQEIAKLKDENRVLGEEKNVLIADKAQLNQELTSTKEVKDQLEKKVDIASTLNASNINIASVDVRKNGKEKSSTTAKRVDKFVVSFDVSNRIIQTGNTDVYVVVIGPDGKAISSGAQASGSFSTREDGDKIYTAKLPVSLETAKTKNVSFSFVPGENFKIGDYKIQIFQNGFLIGQGSRTLKKGGLFS